MSCFIKKEVKHPKFPALSSEVKRLKETEGGAKAVCEVMQKYEKMAIDEALKKEHIEKIQAMLKEGCEKDFILRIGYTEEEYLEAKEQLVSEESSS